ncbi:MAG: hypothetical protein J6K17_11520 [Oscillospiraceae bacterium]|nr:hypothetical protein [Oscillospiraceae bacterium]
MQIKKIIFLLCVLVCLGLVTNVVMFFFISNEHSSSILSFKKFDQNENIFFFSSSTTLLRREEGNDINNFVNNISKNKLLNNLKEFFIQIMSTDNNYFLKVKFEKFNEKYYITELLCDTYSLSFDFFCEFDLSRLETLSYDGLPLGDNLAYFNNCKELKTLCINSHEKINDLVLLNLFKELCNLKYCEIVIYDLNDDSSTYIKKMQDKLSIINPNCEIVFLTPY